MKRIEELRQELRASNVGKHYLKQIDETECVERLCAEIDALRQATPSTPTGAGETPEAGKWARETACALLNEPDPSNVDKWQEVDAFAAKLIAYYPALPSGNAAKEDAERLDWLGKQFSLASRPRHPEDGLHWLKADNHPVAKGETFRAAIDRARQGSQKT